MSLPSHLMMVTAFIDPGMEADWNDWYNNVHLPEVVACPGFISGQRYVADCPDGRRQYIAVYEIEGPAAMEGAEFAARRGWGPFADNVHFETRQLRRIAQIVK